MQKDRRKFLKVSAAALAGAVPAAARAENISAPDDQAGAYGVLVDTVLCVACRQCERACSQANQLCGRDPEWFTGMIELNNPERPDDCAYTVVNRFTATSRPDRTYAIKVQCMHCMEPACVSACIVGALTKDRRGPVVYDAWKCIGCRYCFLACPFDIMTYEYDNALDPQVRKCTFCYSRFGQDGFVPACVRPCPGGALTFGLREDLIDIALLRIKRSPEKYVDKIYGQHEVGGTSWMYLAGVDFTSTPLPNVGEEAISSLTETIQHGVFKSFVPPIALYGLLGLIMHSLRKNG